MDISKTLKDLDEGEWHDWSGTDVRLKVRNLRPFQMQALRRRHIRRVSDKYPDGMDVDGLNESVLNACLIGWEGLTDNGSAYECTEENRIKLFRDVPDFYVFWIKKITKILKVRALEWEDDELGN